MAKDDAERTELLDLYRLAVEEYRFQVNLNWERTQYLLALNVGVLGLGIGLLSVHMHAALVLTACVFALGAGAAALSMMALRTQHSYYRATRDRFKKLEQLLALQPELQIETTPGMEMATGKRAEPRPIRVQTVVTVLLVAVATIDVFGSVWTLVQFLR